MVTFVTMYIDDETLFYQFFYQVQINWLVLFASSSK